MHCQLVRPEVMGRDVSIVSTHEASENPTIRSIIQAETHVDPEASHVQCDLRPR